jgi:hypothetical protein
LGLLDVLDYYYGNETGESIEVEYRLLSWGEIYPPFVGDREHSIAAQFILRDLPFKLFSVSIPYSENPQKLCLTFKAPQIERRKANVMSVGFDPEESAKEFAAFLSLVTRRRVFPVGQTRTNALPVDQPANIYARRHSQERQQLKEIDPSEVYQSLANLQRMNRKVSKSLILSMRLYHSAVEMMYSEPEFAYLFLVTSIEAISSALFAGLLPSDDGQGKTELKTYLDSAYRGWRDLCDISTSEKRKLVIDMLLSNAYRVQYKFRKYVVENLPDKFWTEAVDDAKPHYVYSVISVGPDGKGRKEFSESDKRIQEWEKIKKPQLKKTLDRIYNARSKFVHEGARYPASILIGHFQRLPIEAVTEMLSSQADNRGRKKS